MQMLERFRHRLAEPHLREMLLGSVTGLVIKVLAAFSLFAMNVVVTRHLGAQQAGLFFLAFTLVTITATVGRLGLDQALVRFVATEHTQRKGAGLHSLYRQAVLWSAAASTLLATGLWFSADLLNASLFRLPDFDQVLQAMILATPLAALYLIHAHALQGMKRISQSMLVASVCLPVCLLLFLTLTPVSSASSLSQYFVMSCAVTLLAGAVCWRYQHTTAVPRAGFSPRLLRQTCAPLWAVAVLHQVIQWSSQLMLGSWGSAEDVAYFATAQRTAMLTSFILFAVNSIAAPKFAAMHAAGDMAGLKRLAIMSVRLMLLIAVPILCFILLFPGWLMSFFGEEFRAGAPALVILALGQFVNIATGSVGYLLTMTGNERKVRDNVIISGLFSVVLGVVLIPTFGLIGAATAYACGVATQNLLGVYQVKRQLGFNTLVPVY